MSSRISIRISFGPDDPLNPECGFYFKAESRKGVEMHTHRDPDTGEPLDAWGCICLAQKLFGANPKDERATYSDGWDSAIDAAAKQAESSGFLHSEEHAELIRGLK